MNGTMSINWITKNVIIHKECKAFSPPNNQLKLSRLETRKKGDFCSCILKLNKDIAGLITVQSLISHTQEFSAPLVCQFLVVVSYQVLFTSHFVSLFGLTGGWNCYRSISLSLPPSPSLPSKSVWKFCVLNHKANILMKVFVENINKGRF